MLIAGLWVFAFATRGLISPQSKVWVGIVFGATSFDGIRSSLLMAWGPAVLGLQAANRLRDRHRGGRRLRARRAEEADHPVGPLEHGRRVRSRGDRPSVPEHHHLR